MKISNVIYIFFLFSILSCNRDSVIENTPIHIDPIETQYFSKSSIYGLVTNIKNNPISDAEISYLDYNDKTQITTSDNDGVFFIKNKFLNETGQILKFEKNGYFPQFAFLKPKINDIYYTSVVQLKKNGGHLIDPKKKNDESFIGGKINCKIPKDAFVTKSNIKYSNDVNFFCRSPFLEGEAQYCSSLGFPASDYGISLQGNEVLLFPSMSFFIHFEDKLNNELFLNDSVTIIVPKQNTPCINDEPLILWHYDTNSGYWQALYEIENNNQTNVKLNIIKSGYYYVTLKDNVFVELTGHLYNNNGTPAKNVLINVFDETANSFLFDVVTNNFGKYYIFKLESSKITLSISSCGGNISNFTIDNSSNEIDDIILDETFNFEYNIKLEDNIPNGVFRLTDLSNSYQISEFKEPVTDSFNRELILNGCSFTLEFFSLENLPTVKMSNAILVDQTQTLSLNDVPPNIEVDNYFYAAIEGMPNQIFSLTQYFDSNTNTLESYDPLNTQAIIRFSESLSNCSFTYLDHSREDHTEIVTSNEDSPLDVEISENNANIISGYFSGNIEYYGETRYVYGYFRTIKY